MISAAKKCVRAEHMFRKIKRNKNEKAEGIERDENNITIENECQKRIRKLEFKLIFVVGGGGV